MGVESQLAQPTANFDPHVLAKIIEFVYGYIGAAKRPDLSLDQGIMSLIECVPSALQKRWHGGPHCFAREERLHLNHQGCIAVERQDGGCDP